MPVQETWQPWSKILRAGRTLWRWWWRIKATACTAALTDPHRVDRTQSQSLSEALESQRAPSVWTWALVSTFFFFPIYLLHSLNPLNERVITCLLVLSHSLAACMPGACRATGRGLQPSGLRVKQVGDIKVDTRNAGSGELKVTVKGPSECG